MIKAKKSLSQNFLIDKNICNKILGLTNIQNKEVLEIGSGYGFLTDSLLENNPKKLYLIEKDIKLVNFLKNKYKNNKNVKVIDGDILKFDIQNFKNLTIISNLPYNISTKIILHLFNFSQNIYEMIFMIQKEVALKFDYNLPKMNKYKFLTKLMSRFSRCFDVSPKVFIPRPKVKSTVVIFRLKNQSHEIYKAKSFANSIFNNVRKKIYNNLVIKENYKFNRDLLNKRVNQLNIEELLDIYNSF